MSILSSSFYLYSNGTSGQSGSSITSASFSATAGTSIIVFCRTDPHTLTVSSIKDTNSVNTYTQVDQYEGTHTTAEQGIWFLCPNSGTLSSTTITIQLSGSTTYGAVAVWVISGTNASGIGALSFDKDASTSAASGWTNPLTNASFNTTYANEIVCASLWPETAANDGFAASSGYTMDSPANGTTNALAGYEHQIFTSTQSGITTGMSFATTTQATALYVAAFGIPVCATPTFSPNGGSFGPTQTVTITSATSGSTIYYTTDGSTPTTSSPSISNGGTVSISTTCTLNAIAVLADYSNSAEGSASFTINGAVTTTTFSPAAGTYTGSQTVTFENADSALSGFAMYWITTGNPTTSSTLYTGPITVSSSETVYVLAVATNYSNSAIGSAAYTINSSSGSGIGTVLTGAGTPVKITDFRGYDQLFTSPTTTSNRTLPLSFPVPVVFCDPNGNEYSISGATLGSYSRPPLPIVLCNQQGQPIVPPIVLTSNGNSVTISATLTGNKLGQPTPAMLTDNNGFLYILSGFTYSSGSQSPVPVCVTDQHGNLITLTIGT
jgi:Chitobiase/beta-hexosaminidase C-terminal domain